MAELDGIPTTTVARTLLDLADVVPRPRLERALEQAEILGLFDKRALDEILTRATGRRGAPLLRALVAPHDFEARITRSGLEERLLNLCRQADLPLPQTNQAIALPDGHVTADFVWRERRLIVETDGHRFHGNRHAFERDRRRDQRLLAAGWRVVRFTWRQVIDHPEEVVAILRQLVGDAGGARGR
jgi:very-short-patch-repair endonuclease